MFISIKWFLIYWERKHVECKANKSSKWFIENNDIYGRVENKLRTLLPIFQFE